MADENGQYDHVKPTAGGERENGSRPSRGSGIAAAGGRERMLTERDQALSGTDQTLSGTDQTLASDRDAGAEARDLAAHTRDQAADARDLAMAQRDAADQQAADRTDFGMQIVERAIEHRRRAAKYRVEAAEARVLAAEDRRAAADDRKQAAEQRSRARAERERSATELAIAATDPLTGARTRAAGLEDLRHELDRCRRTSSGLVVASVDVVGLEELNDNIGHGAGDELLRGVVTVFKAHLRSYDLIIRLGGDEFLCAMSNISESDARQRFSAIAGELAAKPDARGIRSGFAALHDEETVAELIARAGGELTDWRHGNLPPDHSPELKALPTKA
jgi:diguanylate cyclase (GGDEF)-like protein